MDSHPLSILLFYLIIRNNDLPGIGGTPLALGLCILLADQMASTVFKPWVGRFRPTNDPSLMYAVDVVNGYRGGKFGFFSSHAANTMAIATFLSLLVRQKSLSLWLYSWALLNCWTRVYLGVHYNAVISPEEKKIVSYPDYGKPPKGYSYITSLYSGMLFNYYC